MVFPCVPSPDRPRLASSFRSDLIKEPVKVAV